MTSDEATAICERFAMAHGVMATFKGEIGFGRPCVGFLRDGRYVAYNPYAYPYVDAVWPLDPRLCPTEARPNAYHKRDSFAVLVRDGDYAASTIELAAWVQSLESHDSVTVSAYPTGATGMQAIISGVIAYAIRIDAVQP